MYLDFDLDVQRLDVFMVSASISFVASSVLLVSLSLCSYGSDSKKSGLSGRKDHQHVEGMRVDEADTKTNAAQHIVLDLDADGVLFGPHGPPFGQQASAQTSGLAMVMPVANEEKHPTPVLPDCTPVEYYSKTHKQWLPGRLQVIVAPGKPQVTYNVKVQEGDGKLKERGNVTLDSFRAIFTEGEPVEVYSKSTKRWVPATIDAYQAGTTLRGYKVQIDEDAEEHAGLILEKVASNRLRRRYADGTLVTRYLGPSEGFCLGIVDRGADVGPDLTFGGSLGSPIHSFASAYISLPEFPLEGIEGRDEDLPRNTEGEPDEPADDRCQWGSVKFREFESNECVAVPTYLIANVTKLR